MPEPRDYWWVRDQRDARRAGFGRGLFIGLLLSIPMWAAGLALLAHFQ